MGGLQEAVDAEIAKYGFAFIIDQNVVL